MTLKVQYGNCVLDECSHSQDASGQGTYSAFEKCHGHAIKQKKKKKITKNMTTEIMMSHFIHKCTLCAI